MIKKTDKAKTITHLQSGNYIYRYVLVDRFKIDTKNHFGFDKKLELTEAEIFALVTPRKLRRKYIINKQENIMPMGKGTYGSKKGRPPKKPKTKPKPKNK